MYRNQTVRVYSVAIRSSSSSSRTHSLQHVLAVMPRKLRFWRLTNFRMRYSDRESLRQPRRWQPSRRIGQFLGTMLCSDIVLIQNVSSPGFGARQEKRAKAHIEGIPNMGPGGISRPTFIAGSVRCAQGMYGSCGCRGGGAYLLALPDTDAFAICCGDSLGSQLFDQCTARPRASGVVIESSCDWTFACLNGYQYELLLGHYEQQIAPVRDLNVVRHSCVKDSLAELPHVQGSVSILSRCSGQVIQPGIFERGVSAPGHTTQLSLSHVGSRDLLILSPLSGPVSEWAHVELSGNSSTDMFRAANQRRALHQVSVVEGLSEAAQVNGKTGDRGTTPVRGTSTTQWASTRIAAAMGAKNPIHKYFVHSAGDARRKCRSRIVGARRSAKEFTSFADARSVSSHVVPISEHAGSQLYPHVSCSNKPITARC